MPAMPSAGDTIANDSRVIEVRVAELRQLFNAIDPSPFRERDLDPDAEKFILDWARDLPTRRRPWRCACTSNGVPGAQTKPHCSAKRFTNTSKPARLPHDEHSANYSVEVASAC